MISALGGREAAAAPAPSVSSASYYHPNYKGRQMANGQPYDPAALTCATWDHPLGAELRLDYVSRRGARRSVRVTVTDRGPHERLVAQGRRFDLSLAAFRVLENPRAGVIEVTVTRLR